MNTRQPIATIVPVILGGALWAACANPVCGCSPVETSASAVVRGVVLDASSAPVQGARVTPEGVLRVECTAAARPVAVVASSTSDPLGRFDLTVSTFDGPGEHCLDLVVARPSSGQSDTVRAVPIRFVPGSVGLPATEVTLRVTG